MKCVDFRNGLLHRIFRNLEGGHTKEDIMRQRKVKDCIAYPNAVWIWMLLFAQAAAPVIMCEKEFESSV